MAASGRQAAYIEAEGYKSKYSSKQVGNIVTAFFELALEVT